jgi:hypothetical protein
MTSAPPLYDEPTRREGDVETGPPHNEGDDHRGHEPGREPSRSNRTGWSAIITLSTQIAVFAGELADILSRL